MELLSAGVVRGGCIAAILAVFAPFSVANAQTVKLDVQGTIEASCALSGLAATVSNLDFTAPDSTTLNFVVDCNAPFAYALESANQGFAPQSVSTAIGGSGTFDSSLPYTVASSFTTDNGSFSDSLASSDLTAANVAPCIGATYSSACENTFSNSGTDVAANPSGNNASLQIAWGAPANPLLAGTYQDTLTLTVRVK